jgi:peptide/nickel transport system ATP-binding protein
LVASPHEAAVPLLEIKGLSVAFQTRNAELQATREISFSVNPGEIVGMVGESGSGKTVTGLSILGLLPRQARITGQVLFEGRDLLTMRSKDILDVRGRKISMIFQEPMSALDPVFTVGEQISETLRTHFRLGRMEAREQAIDALAQVDIPDPARRYNDYPHQLSGGMRQRVMIAIALACKPKMLIADEPTTALDVTIQAQIIDVLLDLSQRSGTALLFITHDLGVVAETCSRVLTMYAGELIEDGPLDAVLTAPLHPYTSALMRSLPRLSPRKSVLPAIPGRVPSLRSMPPGCRFEPRCGYAADQCLARQTVDHVDVRRVLCCRHRELSLSGALA